MRTNFLLQLDYGQAYESARVRCGYPRVSGQELEQIQNELESSDRQFADELATELMLENLIWGLHLVEKRRDCKILNINSTKSYYQRALFLLLVIRHRLVTEFSSEYATLNRSRQCLDWLLASIETSSLNLKTDVVMTFDLLSSKILDLSQNTICLNKMSSDEIFQLIKGADSS